MCSMWGSSFAAGVDMSGSDGRRRWKIFKSIHRISDNLKIVFITLGYHLASQAVAASSKSQP